MVGAKKRLGRERKAPALSQAARVQDGPEQDREEQRDLLLARGSALDVGTGAAGCTYILPFGADVSLGTSDATATLEQERARVVSAALLVQGMELGEGGDAHRGTPGRAPVCAGERGQAGEKGALVSHGARGPRWGRLPTRSPFSPGSPGGPLGPSLPWKGERWGLSSEVWGHPPALQPPGDEGGHSPAARPLRWSRPSPCNQQDPAKRAWRGVNSSHPNLSPRPGPTPLGKGSIQLPEMAKQPRKGCSWELGTIAMGAGPPDPGAAPASHRRLPSRPWVLPSRDNPSGPAVPAGKETTPGLVGNSPQEQPRGKPQLKQKPVLEISRFCQMRGISVPPLAPNSAAPHRVPFQLSVQ